MGKGSARRQEDIGKIWNNWDTIFGKNKSKDIDSATLNVYNDERLVSKFDKQTYTCWCYNCADALRRMSYMIVCPTCGNKRCPRSTDHNLACTNSNDPGQPGSRY